MLWLLQKFYKTNYKANFCKYYAQTQCNRLLQSTKGKILNSLNPLSPDMKMYILFTVLHTFLMELVWTTYLNIKTSYAW